MALGQKNVKLSAEQVSLSWAGAGGHGWGRGIYRQLCSAHLTTTVSSAPAAISPQLVLPRVPLATQADH